MYWRQVHPNFIRDGRPTSQAFTPSLKGENKNELSIDDGLKISAEEAYHNYVKTNKSIGVVLITAEDIECLGLYVVFDCDVDDTKKNSTHGNIMFPDGLSRKEKNHNSKELRNAAIKRGWFYGLLI